nr:hypothetical protein [Tanacetum cinerariifolium]
MMSSSSYHFYLPDIITNINSDHPYNHIYNDLQNDYHQQLAEHIKFLSSKQVYIDDKTMHEDENEDFGLTNFHCKVIDLNYLARKGDGIFENKLNELSEGLVTQNELLGFVSDLKGRSGSKKDSGMYVDASKFGDLLPDKWKILLSLRPGVSPPSLYCKKFVR